MDPVQPGRTPFGTLLRAHRSASGLTQQELASQVGLSVAAIRDLEQGRRLRPRPVSLRGLARALGLEPTQADELEQAALRAGDPGRPPEECRGLRLTVLGPLAARHVAGPRIKLGPPRQRAVLGLLALNPNGWCTGRKSSRRCGSARPRRRRSAWSRPTSAGCAACWLRASLARFAPPGWRPPVPATGWRPRRAYST